jgi:hypothetical protein
MTIQNYPGANVYRSGASGEAAGASQRSSGSTVVDKAKAALAPRDLGRILKVAAPRPSAAALKIEQAR